MSLSNALVSAAFDFGTAYSGYAYSLRSDFNEDPTKILTCEGWPASKGLSMKTATCVLFNEKQEFYSFGYEAENKYMTLASQHLHHNWFFFRRFKMELYGEKSITEKMVIEDVNGKPMGALKVFQAAIKYLKEHFLANIKKFQAVLDDEIQYVLTVPAIWSDSAKKFMRLAANGAGIQDDHLVIALEPEAASIYCQHIKTERVSTDFAKSIVGTKYVVVDIGGGTTDVAVHEKCLGGKIKELFHASGGNWGGNMVDEAFFQFLIRLFGGPVLTKMKKDNLFDFFDIMQEFECQKRNLSLEREDTNYILRVPPSLSKCTKKINKEKIASMLSSDNFPYKDKMKKIGDKILIDISLINKLVKEVASRIVDHVSAVIEQSNVSNISMIILVGGFAESSIVQRHFENRFKSDSCKIIIPPEAGLSVLKGAAMFGHMKDVISWRVLRFNYGINAKVRYNSQKHHEKYKCEEDGGQFCCFIFNPIAKRGDRIPRDQVIKKEYTFKHFHHDESIIDLYSSMNDVHYTFEPGCQRICLIHLGNLIEHPENKPCKVDVEYRFGETELQITIRSKTTGQLVEASCYL